MTVGRRRGRGGERRFAGKIAVIAVACSFSACGAGRPALGPPAVAAAAPRVVAGDLDARPLLGEVAATAQASGAGALAVVAIGEVIEGERIGAFVEAPADACLLVYARASSAVEDVDVALFTDDGNAAALDEGPDPRPTVLLCPPHPTRLHATAHAVVGEGLVAVGAQLVPKERAAQVERALGARGAIGEGLRSADAWPGLDDLVGAHRARLGGHWEEIRRLALVADVRAESFVAFPIEAGQCTDAFLVPDEDVTMIDVEARDGEGRVLSRAREGGTSRFVTVCSAVALTGTLAVRPHGGRGLVAAILSRARGDVARDLAIRPDVAWTAPTVPLETTRAARETLLVGAGYPAASAQKSAQLVIGRRARIAVDVAPSGCTRFDVVGGAPTALLDARVWTDAGELVTSGDGVDAVALFACAAGPGAAGAPGAAKSKGGGPATLEVETRGRPGPIAVLTRAETWTDASFAAHPLAAARMLARATSAPALLHEGTAGPVRAFPLDAAHRASWITPIAAGKCVDVVAGAEGEGTGLELRLSDVADGDEIDRAHASTAVAARACATNAPRRIHVDLASTGGKLDTITGERTTP